MAARAGARVKSGTLLSSSFSLNATAHIERLVQKLKKVPNGKGKCRKTGTALPKGKGRVILNL